MNRDNWTGDQLALLEALQDLVGDRFSTVSRQSAEDVFMEVLDEFPDEEIEESSSGWTGRISRVVERPMFPNSTISGESSVGVQTAIEISADSPDVIDGLLEQLLDVGAVVVQLDSKPSLNELVQMTLQFPDAHLTFDTEGRVVHHAAGGTAIEVSSLTREDRLALQAIRDDMEGADQSMLAPESSQELGQQRSPKPSPGEISVGDSVLEPGAVPVVQENDDPLRSFAPLTSRRSKPRTTSRGSRRRMVQTTSRRQVDLPDPDMHVATSSRRVDKQAGKSTREFYGPPPSWLEASGDPDRIESLVDERVFDILLQLSKNGFTGLLVFWRDDEEYEQLLFDSGYVVERAAKPRITEEELGPMLLAADRITKRQLAMAAAHADEIGLTVARSLMELGILNPEELRHAIAGRLTFLLEEFCTHQKGEVHIFGSQALPAGFLPQPPLRVHAAVERIIYNRLFRRLSQKSTQEREEQMEEALDTYPEIIEHERDRLERAVVGDEQKRLLEGVVTGRKRMREVMTESGLTASETFGVLFSLHRMGLLRFDRSLHNTVVRERLRENITVKYLSVHKASYFEVLNVHWSSYSEVIEDAYENLVGQFDRERMPDDLEDDILEKVDEINERVEAAYAALAKRKTRHAYRTRIMPEYKLDHAIPLFLKQAELAQRRQHWEDARDAIRRVLDIDPDNDEAMRRLDRVDGIIVGDLSPDPSDTNP